MKKNTLIFWAALAMAVMVAPRLEAAMGNVVQDLMKKQQEQGLLKQIQENLAQKKVELETAQKLDQTKAENIAKTQKLQEEHNALVQQEAARKKQIAENEQARKTAAKKIPSRPPSRLKDATQKLIDDAAAAKAEQEHVIQTSAAATDAEGIAAKAKQDYETLLAGSSYDLDAAANLSNIAEAEAQKAIAVLNDDIAAKQAVAKRAEANAQALTAEAQKVHTAQGKSTTPADKEAVKNAMNAAIGAQDAARTARVAVQDAQASLTTANTNLASIKGKVSEPLPSPVQVPPGLVSTAAPTLQEHAAELKRQFEAMRTKLVNQGKLDAATGLFKGGSPNEQYQYNALKQELANVTNELKQMAPPPALSERAPSTQPKPSVAPPIPLRGHEKTAAGAAPARPSLKAISPGQVAGQIQADEAKIAAETAAKEEQLKIEAIKKARAKGKKLAITGRKVTKGSATSIPSALKASTSTKDVTIEVTPPKGKVAAVHEEVGGSVGKAQKPALPTRAAPKAPTKTVEGGVAKTVPPSASVQELPVVAPELATPASISEKVAATQQEVSTLIEEAQKPEGSVTQADVENAASDLKDTLAQSASLEPDQLLTVRQDIENQITQGHESLTKNLEKAKLDLENAEPSQKEQAQLHVKNAQSLLDTWEKETDTLLQGPGASSHRAAAKSVSELMVEPVPTEEQWLVEEVKKGKITPAQATNIAKEEAATVVVPLTPEEEQTLSTLNAEIAKGGQLTDEQKVQQQELKGKQVGSDTNDQRDTMNKTPLKKEVLVYGLGAVVSGGTGSLIYYLVTLPPSGAGAAPGVGAAVDAVTLYNQALVNLDGVLDALIAKCPKLAQGFSAADQAALNAAQATVQTTGIAAGVIPQATKAGAPSAPAVTPTATDKAAYNQALIAQNTLLANTLAANCPGMTAADQTNLAAARAAVDTMAINAQVAINTALDAALTAAATAVPTPVAKPKTPAKKVVKPVKKTAKKPAKKTKKKSKNKTKKKARASKA